MLGHLMTSWHLFHAWAFDDVMKLNIWKVIYKSWLSQEQKELSKWNKKHFFLFHTCSLLDIKQTSKNVADTTVKGSVTW